MGLLILDYLRGSLGQSGFGSKSTAEEVTEGLNLSDKTAIVTGATSGIGAEVARVLAKRGAQVVIPARNLKAAESLKHSILAADSSVKADNIIILKLDLSSLSSVRSFVVQFLSLNLPLHILINNAGVFCKRFRTSEDGFEMSFATNHLGHFLLTKLLLGRMVESAAAGEERGRIVNVSSCLHSWVGSHGIDLARLHDRHSYVESINYAQSKLANILHANELSRRLKEVGGHVAANSVHPGIVKTNITRDRGGFITETIMRIGSIFMKTIPQGAATICYVATHPNVKASSGKYYVDCNEAECSPCANDMNQALKLWKYSEMMTASAW